MNKKSILARMAMAFAMLFAFALSSCSNADADDMFEYIADTDDVVMFINAQDIMQNGGCTFDGTELKSTDGLEKALKPVPKKERDKVIEALNFKGIDLSQVLLTVNVSDERIVFMAPVTDKDDLKKSIEESEVFSSFSKEKKGGDFAYSNGKGTILVDDGIMFLTNCTSGSDAEKTLEKIKGKAEDKPIADWKKKSLTEHTMTMVMNINSMIELAKKGHKMDNKVYTTMVKNFNSYSNADFEKGIYGVVTVDLKGADLNVSIYASTNDGKTVGLKNKLGTIDTDIFKFANSSDVAVVAAVLPNNINFEEAIPQAIAQANGGSIYASQEQAAKQLGSYLNCIDGTVFVAWGPVGTLESMATPSGHHFVVAAKLKPGKSNEFMSLIANYCYDNNISYSTSGNEMQISIPMGSYYEPVMFNLYVRVDGNYLVASTSPGASQGGCRINASDAAGKSMFVKVDLPQNSNILQAIGVNVGVNASVSMSDGVYNFNGKLNGTSEPFLQAVLTTVLEAVDYN